MVSETMQMTTEHVDFKGNLKLDVMMRLFQEAAIADVSKLGFPPHVTFAKNLLWVLAKEYVEIYRLPKFEEKVVVKSWPGKRYMFIFERHYEIADELGNVLVRSTGLWSLINRETRKVADPVKEGIDIQGTLHGDEIRCPMRLSFDELSDKTLFSPKYSQIDINGHLNNTAYFTVALDLIPIDFIKKNDPKSFWVSFKKEIKLGDEVTINYGLLDNTYCFESDNFQIKIDY